MNVKRISLIIDARPIRNSGIGTYLQNILPHLLVDGRFKVGLLGSRVVLEEILQNFEAAAYDVDLMECGSVMYSVREQVEIPCKVPRCDIFWSPHYNIPALPVRAKRRAVTIHDAYHLAHCNTLSPMKKLYAHVVLPLAVLRSNRVITVSDFSKRELIKYTGVSPEKIEVIHNGVDYTGFQKAYDNRALLRQFDLSDYILYVGNVKPHKNVTGLIDAFALFHKVQPDVKLVIVGQKDSFITGINGLDEYIRNLGLEEHVVFTGFVSDEDLHGFYKGARQLVFPSFYEGFGLPPIEAMAAGVPVVASRAASIPEICLDAVYYVDPHNPEDIAHGMIRVYQDTNLSKELIKKGRRRSAALTWQASAYSHMELFERLYTRR